MTRAKKLKKSIRARAQKTGESYTAARRQLLAGKARRSATPAALDAKPTPAKPAAPVRKAGGAVSDATARQRTGHGLEHWFGVLDAFGAVEKGHTAAARHLFADHGVPGWYSQGITVAYERERGVRQVNQRCTGDYEVSVSRVVAAPAPELIRALRVPAERAAWLKDAAPEIPRALRAALDGPKAKALNVRPDGEGRLRYRDGQSAIEWRLTPKGAKTSVVVALTKLEDAAAAEARRVDWRAALDALRAHCTRA